MEITIIIAVTVVIVCIIGAVCTAFIASQAIRLASVAVRFETEKEANDNFEETVADLQAQIDDLKRELEAVKGKQ